MEEEKQPFEEFLRGLSEEQRERAEEVKTTLEYVLEPYIPEELKKSFKIYEFLISKNVALANIPLGWIPRYLTYFDLIALWLKVREPEVAIKIMSRLLMELQLTRSVRGFERLAQITTRTEMRQLMTNLKKKREEGELGGI